jgi:NAD(P)-dependent dehydrogenase (short-subunit alcohol dehydrogenase family)
MDRSGPIPIRVSESGAILVHLSEKFGGAFFGIGLALAQMLLAKGSKVALSGRRAEMVAATVKALGAEGGEVHGIVADIATREGRAATLEKALESWAVWMFSSITRAVSGPGALNKRPKPNSRR